MRSNECRKFPKLFPQNARVYLRWCLMVRAMWTNQKSTSLFDICLPLSKSNWFKFLPAQRLSIVFDMQHYAYSIVLGKQMKARDVGAQDGQIYSLFNFESKYEYTYIIYDMAIHIDYLLCSEKL